MTDLERGAEGKRAGNNKVSREREGRESRMKTNMHKHSELK